MVHTVKETYLVQLYKPFHDVVRSNFIFECVTLALKITVLGRNSHPVSKLTSLKIFGLVHL